MFEYFNFEKFKFCFVINPFFKNCFEKWQIYLKFSIKLYDEDQKLENAKDECHAGCRFEKISFC